MADEVRGFEDAMLGFTECMGAAVPDICSYGWTVGETYIPFQPDEEDECDEDKGEGADCSQLWVRVMSVTPRDDPRSGNMDGDQCGLVLQVDLEVGVLRCFGIPEGGEAPMAAEVLVAAAQSVADMQAISQAALACEVWDMIELGTWGPYGPLGGQYGGVWTFTAEMPGDCLVSGNESI